jgi:hypothetical protein
MKQNAVVLRAFARSIIARTIIARAILTLSIGLALAPGAWAQAQSATNFPMIGIIAGQTLQLNLVAWPPEPAYPPDPCMAVMGFQDSFGNPLGTTKTVTLAVGQSASLTLNGDTLTKKIGARVEVQPTIVTEGTYPPTSCIASAEVMDNLLGITLVAVGGSVGFPPQPFFGMLDLTWFQTARLNVVAFPPDPCIGQLSFANSSGAPVGKTLSVNLNPGQAAFLELPGSVLYPPQPVLGYPPTPIHPMVTLASATGGDVSPTACVASVEVYITLTGQTTAYWLPEPIVPAL